MIKKIKNLIIENSKRLKILFYLFIFLGIFLFLVFNDHGILSIYSLSDKKNDLLSQIDLEKKKNDSLKLVLELVKNDLFTIEKIAREKYGYVKQGEKIYFIDTEVNKAEK